MRHIIKFLFLIFGKVYFRIKLVGRENIPKEGAALICPKHVHTLDSTMIIATFHRKVNALAKEEFFKSSFHRWLAKLYGVYPVKRDGKDIGTVKITTKLLKNKELVMIFPEGTRNGIEKGIKPKTGAVKLAMKNKVPIIPIGVQGNFKPFRKVVLNVGTPIYYNDEKADITKLTEDLMDTILSLTNTKK